MTAVATPLETAAAPDPTSVAVVRRDPLLDAVEQYQNTMGLAASLVKSGFLPRAVNTPEKAVAVILAGREMGIGPMQAVRSINIIDGKPVVAADLQLARFKADGGRATFTELTEKRAVLELVHPNGDHHTETFTIEDAKAAGLLNKDNWKKFPKAMMRSRVITAGLKSVGYEPMAGVYDPDEADHFRPAPAPRAAAKATASPATAAVAQQESQRPEDAEYSVEMDGSGADTDGVSKDPKDLLADAIKLKLPGGPQAWGGKGGTPLGELSGKMLQSVAKWSLGKLAEAGHTIASSDADPRLVQIVEAIELIVAAKGGEDSKQQDLGLTGDVVKDAAAQQATQEGEKRAHPSSPSSTAATSAAASSSTATTTAPSAKPASGTRGSRKSSDAAAGSAEPPSFMSLVKEITALLESADRTDEEKSTIRKQLERAQSTELLQALLKDLALPV